MQTLRSYLSVVLPLALALPLLLHAESPPTGFRPTKLFAIDHPNVTYINDQNFESVVLNSKQPFLVDFYHPFCPYCQAIVKDWELLASQYKDTNRGIAIGAISCMEESLCRKMKITGYPTIIAFNILPNQPGESGRKLGLHGLTEIETFLAEITKNSSHSTTPAPTTSAPDEETTAPQLYENTTLPSNKINRLQDAASAMIYALQSTIFSGEVLDSGELDGLKRWLNLLSRTFPGQFHRQLITKLYDDVKNLSYLDYGNWKAMVKNWQDYTTTKFQELHTPEFLATAQEWEKLPNLFTGNGTFYHFCYSYTCGQWTLFHMLTVNPLEQLKTNSDLVVDVVFGIRRFVELFFGCHDCRQHFIKENPVDVVTKIKNDPQPYIRLKMWLWEMHNKVNVRLQHPTWPKPTVCPTCINGREWNLPEVEKWLVDYYVY